MTAASDWLDQARRLLDAFVQGQAAPAARGSASNGADCAWCPLCQAAAVVRGERPEVTAALADVLTATATALRSFAESVQPAESGMPAATDDEPEAGPHPAVQRIEIA
jgi:hypothetical protein